MGGKAPVRVAASGFRAETFLTCRAGPSVRIDGEQMSSSFLQGVSFFALVVVVVMASFGAFGVL